MIRIIRIKEVKARIGDIANSTLYARVADGTQVPPIKIGPRASGWIESEVDAVNAARVVEKSEDEIRELVKQLIAKRTEMANTILEVA